MIGQSVFTLLCPQESAGLCVSGHVDLVVHLLQNPLIQLDLRVRGQVSTRQDHGPAAGAVRRELDLRR